jgi:hypothetical protein
MGTMTLLRLFILAMILVSIGQAYLLARYLLWPRIRRVTHCPWSSTICHYHARQFRAQSRVRRHLARRLPAVTPTKPAAVLLQAEEVQV